MSELRLVELWRHPVKSLRGERLDCAVVEQNGVAGDRSWSDVQSPGTISNGDPVELVP